MGRDILLDKFFDFIFSLPVIRILNPFWKKKKDIVLYLFFGGLTTVVSLASFGIAFYTFSINEMISNTISWILAVAFAFFTNRVWVFHSPTKTVKAFLYQLITFYGGRLLSFGMEMLIIFIFITKLGYNAMLIKIIAQIIILIANYIISKTIVFRKKKTSEDNK